MTVREKKIRGKWLREFRCCGALWQVLLSPQFRERYDWAPRCPSCQSTLHKR